MTMKPGGCNHSDRRSSDCCCDCDYCSSSPIAADQQLSPSPGAFPLLTIPSDKTVHYVYDTNSKCLTLSWYQAEPVQLGTRYLSTIGINIVLEVVSVELDKVCYLYHITATG